MCQRKCFHGRPVQQRWGQSNHPSSGDLWNELFHLLELTPSTHRRRESNRAMVYSLEWHPGSSVTLCSQLGMNIWHQNSPQDNPLQLSWSEPSGTSQKVSERERERQLKKGRKKEVVKRKLRFGQNCPSSKREGGVRLATVS